MTVTNVTFEEWLRDLTEEAEAMANVAGGRDVPDKELLKVVELVRLIPQLFDKIAHGEQGHRDWLKAAIEAHFSGNPMPEYVAK